ncbi:MAG: beta-ketoacyl synthase N-terminal-like domain-containing protein [Desulfobacterales bacterium]
MTSHPIAVIEASGIFPGSRSLDEFWDHLIHRLDCTGPVPEDRWIAPAASVVSSRNEPDRAVSNRAGLILDFDFDPTGYFLPPEHLLALDPLYHLVLHCGREIAESGRLDSVDPGRIGVVLAAIALPTDAASALSRKLFGKELERRWFPESPAGSRNPVTPLEAMASRVTALPAALLARAFGYRAGSFTLDAACASSLFGIKFACDALRSGRADAMIAGGVSRPDCLYTQIGFSQLQALSPSGRAAPFDADADGLVVGEGAGLVVLKRLEDAVRNGDPILGIIRGMGLSNDMRGSLLAPEMEGQLRAMRAAYADAGWTPDQVDLVECHGAGTLVGDAVELKSLGALWEGASWSPGQCAIGSVKSTIGHLLTAAGIAGLIKILLGLKHRTLPPSLNFNRPRPGSPLENGPFRVQTVAEPWHQRDSATPRRAAVSAFGFGGINAHLLVEEWLPGKTSVPVAAPAPPAEEPVVIVGMSAAFGRYGSLKAFEEAVFKEAHEFGSAPASRWKGCRTVQDLLFRRSPPKGNYLDRLDIPLGRFPIPPREIPDILPQHLLMLAVAMEALSDAGMADEPARPRMGAVIGMGFDFEETQFQLRWSLRRLLREFEGKHGLRTESVEAAGGAKRLADGISPPLTHVRTLGALGSLIASRIAKAFRFGAPSFVLSCEAASGMKALEIGARSLQRHEVDAVLVGAVDLPGDLREMAAADAIRGWSGRPAVHPFDRKADGSLPGEGAAALVLKRLSDATSSGDRIYAVLDGLGSVSGAFAPTEAPASTACSDAIALAFRDAGVGPEAIEYVESHGSGFPPEDRAEREAFHRVFPARPFPCAIGSVKSAIGHAGAAAGLAAVVKTALCLHRRRIPGLPGYAVGEEPGWDSERFHLPRATHYWLRNSEDGPRRACVSAMTPDGVAMAAVLREAPSDAAVPVTAGLHAASLPPLGMFLVDGADPDALLSRLDRLEREASQFDGPIGHAAAAWLREHPPDFGARLAVAVEGSDPRELKRSIAAARTAIRNGTEIRFTPTSAACYASAPLGASSAVALVYPGSGNQFPGMGREIGLFWPGILDEMDRETGRLRDRARPGRLLPCRSEWPPGWESAAMAGLSRDPRDLFCGHVTHGLVVTRLLERLGLRPRAAFGYSLGESAAYFATGAWPHPDEMLKRIQKTDLFTHALYGACRSARKAWGLSETETFEWHAVVVDRPADAIQSALEEFSRVRLLIVNTPEASVIGGDRPQVEALVRRLGANAVPLDGVISVHCDALSPSADAYRDLHRLPVRELNGITLYGCADAAPIRIESDAMAESILRQGLDGFDFPKLVERVYRDGVRIFIETGPGASCTRMIQQILDGRPHLALSASHRHQGDFAAIARIAATLAVHRVPVEWSLLTVRPAAVETASVDPSASIRVVNGGKSIDWPALPALAVDAPSPAPEAASYRVPASVSGPPTPYPTFAQPSIDRLVQDLVESSEQTSAAHERFLSLSQDWIRSYADAVELKSRLLAASPPGTKPGGKTSSAVPAPNVPDTPETALSTPPHPRFPAFSHSGIPAPVFTRGQCMEFAVGSVARLFGPDFAEVDRYRVRVRLPDEPLMLVDRILRIEGRKGQLGPGRIVTEHDVLPDQWYLDGGRAPVCISVEAGQADLFLCAYLGIDLHVRGLRTYRLLDATVTFHRGLPLPGETIRYDIRIEKFIKQGDTWMFFFEFDGSIAGQPLITMRNGCAGFFTEEEVRNSGGILPGEPEETPVPAGGAEPLVAVRSRRIDDEALDALRDGDLEKAFGADFAGIRLPEGQRLPAGRMRLIHRVLDLDPFGGTGGLGAIRAEADIRPDDWFLTCHFVDDQVMPGTLMYECCAHALRVLLQGMGWVSPNEEARFEPLTTAPAVLKCRGPVTPETKKVVYEIEITDIGSNPEPFAIADAMMIADGRRIVRFKGMSLKLSNVGESDLKQFWRKRSEHRPVPGRTVPAVFERRHILAFASGRPSDAFGSRYRPFDDGRFIARLPAPPYSFIDRVTVAEPEPWVLEPGGWLQTEFDVKPWHWYFQANRSDVMPLCVLMEIALQSCGFLAAYMGSALKSEQDLHFRNLDGTATIHENVRRGAFTLTTRCRLLRASSAGDMIIEQFEFEVSREGSPVYTGRTGFGFFTAEALDEQRGIRETFDAGVGAESTAVPVETLTDLPPFLPEDRVDEPDFPPGLPARAIRMIDRIQVAPRQTAGGRVLEMRGFKDVDPAAWYFKAHFHQDPVCPGSLGIESLIQMARCAALDIWRTRYPGHRLELRVGSPHTWQYRGQILPSNKTIVVEASCEEEDGDNGSEFRIDGALKVDGLFIYKLLNFGVRLVADAANAD